MDIKVYLILIIIILIIVFFIIKYFLKVKNNQEQNINKDFTKTDIESDFSTEESPTITQEIKQKEEVVAIEKSPELNLKDLNIANKTQKNILKKLNQFEKERGFLDKNITLNSLASDFGTNKTYLSEIIKNYKNSKNFNQYINELKINYLVKKLNTNQTTLNSKINTLAKEFGFASHSTFSTIFTQYMGETPIEYIKKIKEEKQKINEKN